MTPTAHEHAFEHTVLAATVEVPPRSMLEVPGNVEDMVVGTWLLEQATDKCLPFAGISLRPLTLIKVFRFVPY